MLHVAIKGHEAFDIVPKRQDPPRAIMTLLQHIDSRYFARTILDRPGDGLVIRPGHGSSGLIRSPGLLSDLRSHLVVPTRSHPVDLDSLAHGSDSDLVEAETPYRESSALILSDFILSMDTTQAFLGSTTTDMY
ncbi:Hypothetical protein D9617_11g008320 [Elsinoe fawcettii]|nr:Hypothetical protein D9617_11g008320 [Elsinoe fawcettii]